MRLRPALLALALLAAILPMAPSAASDASAAVVAEELCFGQTPTILGTPGADEVVGTAGPDVVATNGALGARTLGGNDLLCLTGVDPTHQEFYGGDWDTGRGNDRIDATGGVFPNPSGEAPYNLNIHPGPGRDEVLGGPHTLSTGSVIGVSVYAADESAGHVDADIILAGDGPDYVRAGTGDVIDLGGERDYLSISDEGDLSGVVLDGGEGSNIISLTLWSPLNRPDGHHSWKIDNRAGQMVRDGEVVARVSGFLDFDLQVKGPLRFVGSDLAETLDFTVLPPPEAPLGSDPVRRNWPLLLDMHGGDDEVAYSRGGPDSRFDGGDGTDRFSFWADWFPGTMVYLNLATGTLRYIRGGPGAGTHVVGFENVRWWSGADATIIGTAGANKIVTRLRSPDRDVIVHGKRGDDTMRTGDGKDILIGGRGHDVADGGARFDRCEAEVRTHCES